MSKGLKDLAVAETQLVDALPLAGHERGRHASNKSNRCSQLSETKV